MSTGTNEHEAPADLDREAPAFPPEAPPDALLGMRIDARYRIDRIIGRGGMAVVYAGEHLELQRTVAIKVLDEVWATDADAVERFLLEARMASSLTHAHIVSVSDLGRLADGRPYLVMPMIAGADLATLLMYEGPVPAHRVALMLKGVASALDLIHAKGLLHRDIKSENLMHVLNEDGTESVLVLDFGIASACLSRMGEQQGAWSGTPEFMPPEALVGEPPDQRADVYALATVAFELISGRLPFDCENLATMVRDKTEGQPRTLSEATGERLDPALEEVIGQGLARLPDERYGSAGKFIADLEAVSSPAASVPLPRALGTMGPRRGRTLVRGGDTGAASSALRAALRANALERETQPLAPRGSVRPSSPPGAQRRGPLESGTRAIPGRSADREPGQQDPWLFTWSLPKLESGRSSSRPPPAIVEQSETAAHKSQPPVAPGSGLDDEQALQRARRKRRLGRAIRGLAYAVLGAIFVAAAMLLVRNLSEQSERKSASLGVPVRARTTGPDQFRAPPEPTAAAEPADPPPAPSPTETPQPSEPTATAETADPAPDPAPPERASARDTARAAQLTRLSSHALAKGDAQSALENIDRALQLDARYAPAWRGKGMILDSLGHTREAAAAYRAFLKLQTRGEQADTIRKRLWQLSPR